MAREDVLPVLGLAQRAGKLTSGEDMVIDAVRKGKINLILLGSDAGPNTTKNVRDKAKYYNVEVIDEFTCTELSQAIGKLNRVVVGISDRGFSKLVLNKIRG